MTRLQVMGLGIVGGLLLGTAKVISSGEERLEEKEAALEQIQVYEPRVTTTPDELFEEWNSVPHAPYSFIDLDPTYQIYVEERCIEYGLDFFYVISLMQSESSFDTDAVSADGRDYGLMQIRDINWDYFSEEHGLDIRDPFENIECGLLMIADLVNRYGESEAIQLYKCGEFGGIRLWDEGYRHPSIDLILTQRDEWKGESCRDY